MKRTFAAYLWKTKKAVVIRLRSASRFPLPAFCVLLPAACLLFAGCRDGREESPLPRDLGSRELPSSEGSRRAASTALVRKGLDALKRGKSDAAKDWLESAVSLDPTSPYPPHLLGLVALEANNQREAEALFQKAFVLYDTKDEWALECSLLLGVAAQGQRHWATAENAYRTALAISPDNVRAQQGLEAVSSRQ